MTTNTIDPKAFERLLNICGRLGSAQDGEVINAVRLADRELKKMGLTWAEFLTPPEETTVNVNVNVGGAKPNTPPPPPPQPQPQPQPKRYQRAGGSARGMYVAMHVEAGDHKRVAAELIKRNGWRTANERAFVHDQAVSQYDHLSYKQFKWLDDIATHFGVAWRYVANP